MNNRSKVKYIAIVMLFVCINNLVQAADDQTWYENRDEALAVAKEQHKNILLLYGRTTCPNCNAAKKFISESPINEIVLNDFILWFCDIDKDEKKAQAAEYRAFYETGITLPLLCVIDPDRPLPALSYSTGYKNADQIRTILNNDLPTANEDIFAISNQACIAGSILTISTNHIHETIRVYTSAGQLIDSFDKKEPVMMRNAYAYPTGVLIVNSSLGWSIKIANHH